MTLHEGVQIHIRGHNRSMQRRQRLDLIHGHPAFPTVERVLLALGEAGYQGVLAGGCVRDAVLGVAPKDLDVATSAPPDAVERLFRATLAVGKAFGTIVVVENGFNFEVTTFRSEGPYLDGRHPSSVAFSSMEEDAKRRDFTVNAMFYDPMEHLLYDFHDGLGDLAAQVIRTVGMAVERFGEDRLRMLRAVRFVAQLGFRIEDETMLAIQSQSGAIADVSAERVLNEMQRLLGSSHMREGLAELMRSRLHAVVWPELDSLEVEKLKAFLSFLSWENAFAAVCLLLRVDPELRLRTWKASRESLKRVATQIEAAETLVNERSSRAERIQALGGPEYAPTLVLASGLLSLKKERPKLEEWIAEYLSVAGPNGELPRAFLNGDDLTAAGVPQSQKMGEYLRELYRAQLEGEIRSREEALSFLARLKDSNS